MIFGVLTQGFCAYGGIANATQDIVHALTDNEASVSFEALTLTGEASDDYLTGRIRQRKPIPNKVLFSFTVLWETFRLKPNVIYCNHLFLAPLVAIVAALYGKPFMLHLHGLELKGRNRLLQRLALRRASKLICVSNDTAELARRFSSVALDNVVILPNRVRSLFKPPADRYLLRRRLGIPDGPALLTVSRLDPFQKHKGHDLILQSLGRLLNMWPDLKYYIVGEGDDRRRLELLADNLGVRDSVHFLGRISDEELVNWYGAVDLYVMPSSGDGFGIAFVEAMACGTTALGLSEGGAVDALRPGELGYACPREEFDDVLYGLVEVSLNQTLKEKQDLSSKTRLMFGESAFNSRVKSLLHSLVTLA